MRSQVQCGVRGGLWGAVVLLAACTGDVQAQGLIPGIDPFTQDYVVLGSDGINSSPSSNPHFVNPGMYDSMRDTFSALHTEQAKRAALANHARAVRQYWAQRNAILKQYGDDIPADDAKPVDAKSGDANAADAKAPDAKAPDAKPTSPKPADPKAKEAKAPATKEVAAAKAGDKPAEKAPPTARQRMEWARIKATAHPRQVPLVNNSKVFQRPTEQEVHPKTGAIQWPPVLQTEFFKPYRDQMDVLFAKRVSGKEPNGINSANYQMIEVVAHAMSQEMHAYASGMPPAEYLEGLSFLNKLAYEGQQIGPDYTNLPSRSSVGVGD